MNVHSTLQTTLLGVVLALTAVACTSDRPKSADLQQPNSAPDVLRDAQIPDLSDVFSEDTSPRDAGNDAAPDMADSAIGDTEIADISTDIGTDMASDTMVDADRPDVDQPDVLQPGTAGLRLRGVVMQPEAILDPGEVLIIDGEIVCVAEDCSDAMGAEDATWIDTGGVISPGLIDAHNHLPYNFLDEWVPPAGTSFTNRYQWADDPTYEAWVDPYANNRSASTHYCPAAKWGEWRALIHGTTTMQGQSFDRRCIRSWVRNADHSHELQYDHMRTWIASVRDITDDDAASFVEGFDDEREPVTRLAVHMTEGVSDNNIDDEFDSFAGRDTRNNRHQGISLLGESSILIHAVSLTDEQLMETAEAGAHIVWSPSSNMVLYEATANIDTILDLGIVTGLGPDWTLSGEDNMPAEMRFAYDWAIDNDAMRVTPEVLWRMATTDGAKVVGLDDFVGKIEEGYRADIVVFASEPGADPFDVVMRSRAQDIRLVLVDGRGFYGDASLQESTAMNDTCVPFDACGVAKYFCAQDPNEDDRGTETLENVRDQLFNILEGIGYPEDEQYMRGDEILDLITCE